MDDLAALRLQMEWGADEALLETAVDRLATGIAEMSAVPVQRAVVAVARAPADADRVDVPAAEAADLVALHAALDALDHPLRATATTTVRPSGNPAAGLVWIGEAPGRDDDRAGEAYSGAPGELLDEVLASAGLDRGQLLLAFVVPWRPPGGREASAAEAAACRPYLHRLLALTQPRHLVLMGQGALRALTPLQALRPARGRWTTAAVDGVDGPLPALPMLSPEQWRKNAATRASTWCDLLTLRDRLASD